MATESVNSYDASSGKRLFLVSCPRTASNLLVKVLALTKQPEVRINERGGYVLWDAFISTNFDGRMFKPLDQWTATDKAKLQKQCQQCLDELEQSSAAAQREGKMFVTKEHASWFQNMSAIQQYLYGANVIDDEPPCTLQYPDAYGVPQTPQYSPDNQTFFADEYLRTWRAAFIIRHPALVFPSAQRTLAKLLKEEMDPEILQRSISINMTFRWARRLFDFFREQTETTPAVLDANDLINDPLVVAKFSKIIGMDPTQLQFEWDTQARKDNDGQSTEEERRQQMEAFMLSTLHSSSGLVKDKAPSHIDLAVEAAKWKNEFGDRVASMLEKAVVAAMPDYEYLTARRVQLDGVEDSLSKVLAAENRA